MKIVFSKHSQNQIKKRHLSKKSIVQAIKNPDKIISSFRDRKLIRKEFDDNILEIVVKAEDSKIIVITAYILKEDKL